MGHPLPQDASAAAATSSSSADAGPADASSGTRPPLVRAALALLPRMNQQELCNSFWALAVLQQLDVDSFGAFCDHLARGATDMTPEGMHQVRARWRCIGA